MALSSGVANASQKDLLKKYDLPTPRYTSYPTVPYWDEESFTENKWKEEITRSFKVANNSTGVSLYLHLPFCEQLCTYCGCNKRITVNHSVELPYINALLKEWEMYLKLFGEAPKISELHLGGGTPTFFSAQNLHYLISSILEQSIVMENPEFSLEVHPNYTTREQLQVLYDLGFRRLSVGVQDFDPKVQFVINRLQSFQKTKDTFDAAREIGYTSINADIIYGLPLQTEASVLMTVEKVKQLRPERIAFYSYAHVPWKSKAQRRYSDEDLPSAEEKRKLYELGRQLLEEAGYVEFGMDHFALPNDSLFDAASKGEMHRNFMGYTTKRTELLLGLGVSSISDSWGGFMQNVKEVEEYERIIAEEKLPILKGHILTSEDLVIRQHILNLMCKFYTSWEEESLQLPMMEEIIERLQELELDGLVVVGENFLQVTEKGKPFVRNICICLDERLWRNKPTTAVFSKSI